MHPACGNKYVDEAIFSSASVSLWSLLPPTRFHADLAAASTTLCQSVSLLIPLDISTEWDPLDDGAFGGLLQCS